MSKGRFSALRGLTEDEPALPIASFTPAIVQGDIKLNLDEIVVEDRIRTCLDEAKVQDLATSIREFGFRGSLWVRQKAGRYYLVAGGRRYAACQLAGVKSVAVDVIEASDTQAVMLELAENFQRQDLNPLEETIGILRLLESTLKMTQDEVVSLFQRQQRRGNSTENNVILSPQRSQIEEFSSLLRQVESAAAEAEAFDDAQRWEIVEVSFQMIGKLTPDSFRTNRLPLLKLPESIKAVISDGSLEYSKARVIAKVSDPTLRETLLASAIESGWSLSEIKTQISAAQNVSPEQPQSEAEQFRSSAADVIKRLKSASLKGRSLKKAQRLLGELEALLEKE